MLFGGAVLPLLAVTGCSSALAEPKAETGTQLDVSDFVGTLVIREGEKLSYDLDMKDKLIDAPEIDLSTGKLTVQGVDVEVRNCRTSHDKSGCS